MFPRTNPTRTIAAILGLAALLAATPAVAGEGDDLAVSVDLGVFSEYVWRGIETVDRPVLQPAVDLSFGDFGVNLWANADLTNRVDEQPFVTEIDLTGSWSKNFDDVQVGAGAIAYFFPGLDGDTTELYAGVGFDTVLAPTLTVYRDVDEVDGFYFTLSGSHTFGDLLDLGEGSALSPELSIVIGYGDSDYNGAYHGVADAGFSDLTIGLAVPIPLCDAATLVASANYSRLLDGDIRDASDEPDNFWVGLTVSIGF